MDELEIAHIIGNLSDLVENTICGSTCIAFLIEKGILGRDDASALDAIHDEMKKALKFYNIVMTKSDSYGYLITSLNMSSQSGAVEILRRLECKKYLTENVHHTGGSTLTRSNSNDPHFQISMRPRSRCITPIRFDVLDPVLLFTGRIVELEQLHEMLQQSKRKTTIISKMASIVGLGGIGKTELARAYIQKYSELYDNNVIWINAETEDSLTECFRRLATDYLNLSILNVVGKEMLITSIIDRVFSFFIGVQSLFVFDNAGSSEYIHKFMPLRVSDKPYLLITSRDRDWEFGIETLELREMDEQEAMEFVKKGLHTKDNNQYVGIIQLVKRLQCFPLAMSQAVSYIKQKQRLVAFNIDEYLELFETCTEQLLNSGLPATQLNSYTETTITTWKVTTDLISASGDVGRRAMAILNMISYFQPDRIPTKHLVFYNPEAGRFLYYHEQNNEEPIGLLVKYSMVNVHVAEKNISVHRLVQEVNRTQLRESKLEEAILRNAIKSFSATIDMNLINHAHSVFKYCALYNSLVVEFKAVPDKILLTLNAHGASVYAFNIAVELKKILLNCISPLDVDVLRLESKIARLEHYVSSLEKCLKTLKRLLPFYKENKNWMFCEMEIIENQLQFARILEDLGRRTESLEFLLQAYQKSTTLFGENDLKTLETLADIANCLRKLGHFNGHPPANSAYLKTLPDELKTNDPEKIISLLKKGFDNKKHLIGSIDGYATIFPKVAQCFQHFGYKDMAASVFSYIYEVGRDSHKFELQCNAMHCLNSLAIIKNGERKHEEALKMLQEIHAFNSSMLGHTNLSTLVTRKNMLICQSELCKNETVLDDLQDVLRMMQTYYPEAPQAANLERDIAFTLYEMKRYHESLSMFLVLKTKLQQKFPQLKSLLSDINILINVVQKCVD